MLLRLSHFHDPCPEWVLLASRKLQEADLVDALALPESGHPLRVALEDWKEKLQQHPLLMEKFQPLVKQSHQIAPRRLAISVVTPFHGRVSELQVALAALEHQTIQNFDVVVVADGCAVEPGPPKSLSP